MPILGPDGRAVKPQTLTRRIAEPGLTGIRQIWAASAASGLTPERLAGILTDCDQGEMDAWLTLAEEMEERDPHYGSVLGIRKRAVSAIVPVVTPASGSALDKRVAEAVETRIARHPKFADLVEDMLDALGKGFSVIEIDWALSATEWWPRNFIHRDPRWFRFDRQTGRDLRLRDEAAPVEGLALEPWKFLEHRTKLKSGLPQRGGLARLVAFSWMCKAYTLKDWMAFVETYGLPLRLGRYGPEATSDDISALFRAVANIGTDAAAVLPRSMAIEFENGPAATGDRVFENLARYVDEQISKAVLGQTMTSDNGSSQAQANVHNEVRHDIAKADARAVSGSIAAGLIAPYVAFNFGDVPCPGFAIEISEPEDIKAKIEAAAALIDRGVEIRASELRRVAGFGDPEPGDVVARPRTSGASEADRTARNHESGCGCGSTRTALNRAGGPSVADVLDEIEDASDWTEIAGGIEAAVINALEAARDYDDLLARLPELLTRMPTALTVETLVKGMFAARALGDQRDG